MVTSTPNAREMFRDGINARNAAISTFYITLQQGYVTRTQLDQKSPDVPVGKVMDAFFAVIETNKVIGDAVDAARDDVRELRSKIRSEASPSEEALRALRRAEHIADAYHQVMELTWRDIIGQQMTRAFNDVYPFRNPMGNGGTGPFGADSGNNRSC